MNAIKYTVMPQWLTRLFQALTKRSPADAKHGERWWNELTHSNDVDYSPDHVRSQIIDAEEALHLRQTWQRISVALAIFVSLATTTAAIYIKAVRDALLPKNPWTSVFVLILLLVVASLLAYRQYKRIRRLRVVIRKLNILLRRIKSETSEESGPGDVVEAVLAEQKRYRDELPEVISQYRDEANKYRRVHNRLQSVIIIGSVATSAITTASVSYEKVRWFAVAVSALVGLAAGFTGYFKYRERSFNLQQTADSIEREYESVLLRVGRYSNKGEAEAYMLFATVVEDLRDEQNKRQQQLDQPVEVRQEQ